MVAILVDSREDGETGWVATRGLSKLQVEGLSGCQLRVMCLDTMDTIVISEDGVYDLPEGTEMVKVRHSETNGDSKVFVDLVR